MSYDIVAHVCTKIEHVTAVLEFNERRYGSTTRETINNRRPGAQLKSAAPFLLTDKAKGIYAPPALCIPRHLSGEFGTYLRAMCVEGALRGEMGWVWHSMGDVAEVRRRLSGTPILTHHNSQLNEVKEFWSDCEAFLVEVENYLPGAGLELHYF